MSALSRLHGITTQNITLFVYWCRLLHCNMCWPVYTDKSNSSVFRTAYIFTFRLFNDNISTADGFIVTNGMFIVNCKYHWSNLLCSGTAVCPHCGTDHNLITEEVDVAVILYACIREVFSSNLTWDTSYHDWGLSCFSSISPGKFQDITSIRPWILPSTSFLIHYPLNHLTIWHSVVWSPDANVKSSIIKNKNLSKHLCPQWT